MAALSKPSAVHFTCYEIAHTWCPSCSRAWLAVGMPAFLVALRVYTPLFVLSRLLLRRRRRHNQVDDRVAVATQLVRDILRSSLFLGANCYLFMASFCAVRRVWPRSLHLRSLMLAAGMLGSLLAVMIERRSRRLPLAVYMLNIASEAGVRWLRARHVLPHVRHSRRLLAVTALTTLLVLHKKGACVDGVLDTLARAVLGTTEMMPSDAARDSTTAVDQATAGRRLWCWLLARAGREADEKTVATSQDNDHVKTDAITSGPTAACHPVCSHQRSCMYYALTGFAESFLLGASIRTCLLALGNAVALCRWLVARTMNKTSAVTLRSRLVSVSGHQLRLAMSLGSITLLFRTVNCLLRRYCREQRCWHALPAALLASSVALSCYRHPSLELYLFWKTVECCCRLAVVRLCLPREQQTDRQSEDCWWRRCGRIMYTSPVGPCLLYALSTGVVLAICALEPQHLRPSYWTFLKQVTGGNVVLLNRPLMSARCHTDSLCLTDARRAVIKLSAEHVAPSSRPFFRQLGQI